MPEQVGLDERGELNLRRALQVLRRRALLIVLCVLAAGGSALAFSLRQQKQYTSTASLLFGNPGFDQELFGVPTTPPTATSDAARQAATNIALVSLPTVADRTAQALGHGLTGGKVKSEISISPQGQSDLVSISATDPHPPLAAQLANTFATQFIAFRRESDRATLRQAQQLVKLELGQISPGQMHSARALALRKRADDLKTLAALQTGNAEVVQSAAIPTSPSSPNPRRDGLLGAGLGVLLGLLLAFLFERFDRRIRRPEEVGEIFGRPILAAIPESPRLAREGPNPRELRAREAESFRMLLATLRYFNVRERLHSILVTSAAPGDGKTTISWNLAVAAARTGQKVLLIEADLRHPSMGHRWNHRGTTGLSSVLAGVTSPEEAIRTLKVMAPRKEGAPARTMDVLLAGAIPPNPSDLIDSDEMRSLLKEFEQRYDLVIVDTPPTSVVSDAIPLVTEVSGVIIVSRLGQSTRDAARELARQLEHLGAPVMGVVANSMSRGEGTYSYYGYGYGYGERNGDGEVVVVGDADKAPPLTSGMPERADEAPANGPAGPAVANSLAPARVPGSETEPSVQANGGAAPAGDQTASVATMAPEAEVPHQSPMGEQPPQVGDQPSGAAPSEQPGEANRRGRLRDRLRRST